MIMCTYMIKFCIKICTLDTSFWQHIMWGFFHAEFRSSEIGDSETWHYPVHKARSGVIWSCCQVCCAGFRFRICEEKSKHSNTVYNWNISIFCLFIIIVKIELIEEILRCNLKNAHHLKCSSVSKFQLWFISGFGLHDDDDIYGKKNIVSDCSQILSSK